MKLFYKTKALVCGMYPMINFKIDGFIQKSEKYDESKTDPNHPDYIFYSTGHLLKSASAYEGKDGYYFECFESEEKTEIEVNDTTVKEEIMKTDEYQKLENYQRKVREEEKSWHYPTKVPEADRKALQHHRPF